MTDSLRTRIADVQRAHRLWQRAAGSKQCGCGWTAQFPVTDHPEHVADAVIRELRLEREHWQYGDGHTMGVRHRYVTEWETDD